MRLKFINKKFETGNIWSFYFEPLEGVTWIAGQYLNLTMPGVPPVFADRLFTIASAPHEKQIQITTFIGESPFKQKLKDLLAGSEVEADQVGGDFYLLENPHTVIASLSSDLPENPKRLFLAGGLGITPFRSMVADSVHKKTPLNTDLFWSGSDEKCPFMDELSDCAAEDVSLKITRFVDERITIEKILNKLPDVSQRLIYLSGSQSFVESLGEGLMAKGVPRNQIKYDWFDGYTGELV